MDKTCGQLSLSLSCCSHLKTENAADIDRENGRVACGQCQTAAGGYYVIFLLLGN